MQLMMDVRHLPRPVNNPMLLPRPVFPRLARTLSDARASEVLFATFDPIHASNCRKKGSSAAGKVGFTATPALTMCKSLEDFKSLVNRTYELVPQPRPTKMSGGRGYCAYRCI